MKKLSKFSRLLTLSLTALLLTACGGGGSDDLPFIDGDNNLRDIDDVLDEREQNNDDGGAEVIDEDGTTFDDIEVSQDNVQVLIPGRALLEVIDVTIDTANIAAPLPVGMTQVGNGIVVSVSDEHQELLNGPASITVDYSSLSIGNESNLVALYFDGSTYQPLTIISQDQQADILTFESRRFDTFVLAEATSDAPALFDTGFDASLDSWNIENFGTYFAPGGNSFGMAGFAAWYYDNGGSLLSTAYLEETAIIAAARVQISQGETWGSQEWRQNLSLPGSRVAGLIKTYIKTFNSPLVMVLGTTGPTKAAVVYGFDANNFFFYDPDFPGESQSVSYSDGNFGQYNGLKVLGYAALASFGRNSDFSALAQEADNNFAGSENLAIDTPLEDEEIAARETELTGSFLNDLSEETSLYVEIKGIGRQLTVTNGTFSNIIEISSGENTIVALAGVDASVENNWFKDAPTAIRNVVGTLPPARLLVTLTWEQDETDVDLYVTEPGGETMWFGNRSTSNGLELDFDDTTGFGPEHGTLEQAELGDNDPDETLEGEYIIRVHYFSDDGLDVDATGKVTIIVNEGDDNQNTLSLRFTIENDNSSASGPDGSGSSWVNIAKVDVISGTFDTDFSND